MERHEDLNRAEEHGVADIGGAAPGAGARELPPVLRQAVRVSLVGLVASVTLLGDIRETQLAFYALISASLLVYLLARGEELLDSIAHYLTSPTTVWRWAFAVWAVLSLLWTARSGVSAERAMTVLEIQAVGLLFFDAARNLGQTRWILGSVLVCTVAASVHAVLSEDPEASWRIAGAYRNPNTLGIVAVMGMTLCVSGMGYLRRLGAVVASYVVMLVLLIGVLASASLKGLGGTAFALLAGSFYPRARARIAVLAAAGAALLATLVFTYEPVRFLWEHTVYRVQATMTTFGTAADVGRSFAERARFIAKGLDLISESPLFGTGLDTFNWLSGEGTYAHNNFVEVGVALGFIGVALYYAFHVSILRQAWRRENAGIFESRFAVLLVLMLIVLDMASVSYAAKLPTLLMITCAGWLERRRAGLRGRAPAEATAA